MLRAAYLDLDGTLLGRGASLLHDADGDFTLLGARALEACARAEVEVVPYSGRRQSTLLHDARMLGLRSYIFEAGCGLVLDGELEWLTDGLEPRDGKTIHEQIEESGAPALLLEHYAGRLRDLRAVALRPRGLPPLPRRRRSTPSRPTRCWSSTASATCASSTTGSCRASMGDGRAYHLIPRAASKARAVARHMQARGYAPEEVIAVGDSREDLGAAARRRHVLARRQRARARAGAARGDGAFANVRVAEASHGAGVYEAVITTLAERALSAAAARIACGGAVDVGLGRRPARHRYAHRRLAVPARPADPARAVLLHAARSPRPSLRRSPPKRSSTWFRTTSLSTSTPSAEPTAEASRRASAQHRSTSSATPSRPSDRSAA